MEIRRDDLSGRAVRALLEAHVAGMRAASPPDGVSALDLPGLLVPAVTVWTVWRQGELAGVGALKMLDGVAGELKSMRTHPDHLRRGVGGTLLDFMIAEARARGRTRLSLETGSGPAFEPAHALYRSRGFTEGSAFSDYEKSSFNRFFHLTLPPLANVQGLIE